MDKFRLKRGRGDRHK